MPCFTSLIFLYSCCAPVNQQPPSTAATTTSASSLSLSFLLSRSLSLPLRVSNRPQHSNNHNFFFFCSWLFIWYVFIGLSWIFEWKSNLKADKFLLGFAVLCFTLLILLFYSCGTQCLSFEQVLLIAKLLCFFIMEPWRLSLCGSVLGVKTSWCSKMDLLSIIYCNHYIIKSKAKHKNLILLVCLVIFFILLLI